MTAEPRQEEKAREDKMSAVIQVRQLGTPPSGNHWSMGPNHMRRISRKSAKGLCGIYPIPEVGYETIVALKDDGYGGKFRLYVQNVSGDYYVASSQVTVEKWPEIFQVELV